MGASQHDHNVPVFDISPWVNSFAGNSVYPKASDGLSLISSELHKVCLEYGFFYLDVSELVNAREMVELIDLARKLFALLHEQKEYENKGKEISARGGHKQT